MKKTYEKPALVRAGGLTKHTAQEPGLSELTIPSD
jgi:hypothetical protein